MSNLKPKFGPKVCLAPPCQAFNLTLGQNACFALPHVKLEIQIRAKGLSSQALTLSKTLVLRSRRSNVKPTFGPKVCLAPPCQAFNLIHWGKTLVLRSRMSNLKPKFGPKVCLAKPCQGFNLIHWGKTLVLRSRMSNLKPKFWPKVCLAPPCQVFNLIHWGETLVLRSRMSNLKPKFGPKVCLAPPCQAFNLTLGQNACFALPHVKLETQIRAKGLSSPTMPSLQHYIGAKRLFCAPACQT